MGKKHILIGGRIVKPITSRLVPFHSMQSPSPTVIGGKIGGPPDGPV
jgi:hypothetical protein